MTSQVDKVVKIFKTVAQYPSPKSARLLRGVAGSNGISIVSYWSQRNLERGKSTKFQQMHFLDSSLQKASSMLPVDTSFEVLSAFSKSEELRAVIREIPSENNSKKQYLEIWKNQLLWKNFDLSALEVHGDVYADGDFASFEWSPCEQKLLYIAEKKPPKTEPFYKQKSQESKENGIASSKAIKGEEYAFRPDWGEQLEGKHQSVVVMVDMKTDNISVLEGIPSYFSPAQAIWTPDGKGIVGVAWKNEPRRLGIIYCTNRNSCIFHLTTEGVFSVIHGDENAMRSPRFSPNGEILIWLQRPCGGPHHAAHKLISCRWSTREINTVIDIVRQQVPTTGGSPFYGLYNLSLPRRCWSEDSTRIVLSTPQRCNISTYVINIDDKSITELECTEGSHMIMDVWQDIVLCCKSSLKMPHSLIVGRLPPKNCERQIVWFAATDWHIDSLLESFHCHYLALSQPEPQTTTKAFTAIYFGPETNVNQEVPLVVWPHGGPHSTFTNDFKLEAALLALAGFGMLMVNYRGSIGAGQDSVEFLLGKIGDTDVKDVHLATLEALKQFPFLNPNKVVLFGGSHGGFLVTHLSGQYPDMYKAVVARNPVIDVSTMYTISDIPDWSAVECGFQYHEGKDMDIAAFEKMKKCSPISFVSKVKAPTLLLIGSKDRRVPSSQGIQFYYRLKENGVKTRLLLYEDNHPLGTVPVDMDNLINSVLWLLQHGLIA